MWGFNDDVQVCSTQKRFFPCFLKFVLKTLIKVVSILKADGATCGATLFYACVSESSVIYLQKEVM